MHGCDPVPRIQQDVGWRHHFPERSFQAISVDRRYRQSDQCWHRYLGTAGWLQHKKVRLDPIAHGGGEDRQLSRAPAARRRVEDDVPHSTLAATAISKIGDENVWG
jgi:hypothetical protein